MRGFHELELFDCLNTTEYEANLFAAELLIDDNELLELLNNSEKSFFGVAKELYIPAELLDFKMCIRDSFTSAVKNSPVSTAQ